MPFGFSLMVMGSEKGFKGILWRRNACEIQGKLQGPSPALFLLALKGKRALNNMPSLGSFAKNRI